MNTRQSFRTGLWWCVSSQLVEMPVRAQEVIFLFWLEVRSFCPRLCVSEEFIPLVRCECGLHLCRRHCTYDQFDVVVFLAFFPVLLPSGRHPYQMPEHTSLDLEPICLGRPYQVQNALDAISSRVIKALNLTHALLLIYTRGNPVINTIKT